MYLYIYLNKCQALMCHLKYMGKEKHLLMCKASEKKRNIKIFELLNKVYAFK